MSKCVKCGSYAFNLYKEDIDQGGLCDVHYWQYRAHRAEALAEQPAQQEPVAQYIGEGSEGSLVQLYDDVKKGTNFYTFPPAQRTWVGLTYEEVRKVNQEVWGYVSADHARMRGYAQAIEAKLKEKNNG